MVLLVGWQLGILHERGRESLSVGAQPNFSGKISPGLTASGVTVSNPARDVDISLLWETWEELTDHYIDPKKVEVTPLVYGAVEGMVRGLGDPYTVFMTPQENTDFRDGLAGNLEGIGAELTFRESLVVIVSPLKGSPAERAGLRPKDIIIEVDGQSTENMNLSQVVTRIRGPKGTPVKIRVAREQAGELDFTLTREAIHVPSVETHRIVTGGKTYGFVALQQFGQSSIAELTQELRTLQGENIDGLILDMRNNGGGYLDGAIDLVSLFVREGDVVTVERGSGRGDTESVHGKALLPDLPLVVLQNDATASAAEIVSGALQDHKRARVVGLKSFGKGTVQEVVDLPGGASLRVTVARWLTPSGRSLDKDGVHPDIEIQPKTPDQNPPDVGAPWGWKTDPQITAAVEVLQGKRK